MSLLQDYVIYQLLKPKQLLIFEIANGIDLCVKQPVVYAPYGDTILPKRSLAFNQLCYWYADEYADEIKNKFREFSNGQVIEDYKCNGCFDGDFWQIEIYDHGKYSSIIKDYMTTTDSSFVLYILQKSKQIVLLLLTIS